MRFAFPLVLAALAAGCASGPSGRVHPPVAPAEEAENAPYAAPVEGTEFTVFRGDGTPATLDDVVREAGTVEVVLFGEEHDDLMTHRLQVELLRRLFYQYQRGDMSASPHGGGASSAPRTGADREVILSMEMFERDVQHVVDEYLADLITEDHFKTSARSWPYYEDRYRDAVEFAKSHRIPLVAANAPRRYVNRASRLGRDSLDELPPSALATLPPLPYPQGSELYRAQWDSIMEGAPEPSGTPFDGQTLWDAGMAHSIAGTLDGPGNPLVVHFAGSFHVSSFTGIPEVLEHYRPGTRRLVLVGRPVEELGSLPEEFLGDGDFVFLTPAFR